MENQAFIKLIAAVFFSTAFLISFSQLGVFAYERVFSKEFHFSPGTFVANVDVSSLSRKETEQLILNKVNKWRDSQSTKIAFSEKEIEVPSDLFIFEIAKSVEQVRDGRASALAVELDRERLRSLLNTSLGEKWMQFVDMERLEQDLSHRAALLQTEKPIFHLTDYLNGKTKVELKNRVISEVRLEKGLESYGDLLDWLSSHSAILIKEKNYFSLSDYIKSGKQHLSPESASCLASLIYQAILPSNFRIAERHVSEELPDNIKPGFEARVDLGSKDFVFYNPNFANYTLNFIVSKDSLIVQFRGIPFINKYVVERNHIEYFAPKTVIHYNPNLQEGEKKIEQEGKSGLLVKTERKIYAPDGYLLKSQLISEDVYLPVYKIETHPFIQEENRNEGMETNLEAGQANPSDNHTTTTVNEEQKSSGIGNPNVNKANEQTEVYEK